MKNLMILVMLITFVQTCFSAEYHVSTEGSDNNPGTESSPFQTISAAASRAMPGDIITVHAGVYRECVTPPRGGDSNDKRIVYRAAEGEEVIIKGSEIVSGWENSGNGVWKVVLPAAFFGDYNPYQDRIEGDWFDGRDRIHHTGEVFLNGRSLYEKASLAEVENPQPYEDSRDKQASLYTWYCESDKEKTTIWANFHDADPNKVRVEISVRKACFYPEKPGCNFITIRGFHFSQAATQWAAPTAEQIGLIGTHWSKGWIIENNVISDSKCSGITLGKDRATGHNVWSKDRKKDGAIHYVEVIFRALKAGWSKETIGSHVVRNNVIFNCEQTGICGSLGAAFSTIKNNHIYNIWTKRQFRGAEIAGIKLHAAIDVRIEKNRIHNAGRGLWMDWMAQGTRITGNLCYDNTTDDLFLEVDHGPYLVDNNIFLSDVPLRDWSEGGAFVHNLFSGQIKQRPSIRYTPYHFAHDTRVAGLINIAGGDDRFFNNIFIGSGKELLTSPNPNERQKIGFGLAIYNETGWPMVVDGNIYLKNAEPFINENHFLQSQTFDPQIKLNEQADKVTLSFFVDPDLYTLQTSIVNTERLGSSQITGLSYENPDGSPLTIDLDYTGKKRSESGPTAGPFEDPGYGKVTIQVW